MARYRKTQGPFIYWSDKEPTVMKILWKTKGIIGGSRKPRTHVKPGKVWANVKPVKR